jgi:diguanylate cyclase (GGDEF)-like protein
VVLVISLLGATITVVAALTWHLVHRERAARRALDAAVHELQHDRDTLLRRRSVERELEHRLEHAESEDEVVDLVRDALQTIDANRPFELHLVDEQEPLLFLAFATGATRPGAPDVTSPWDSTAARDGVTLVYASTDAADVCPHLRARLVEHCSAICIPLLAMGRIVGVLYAMGPIGAEPPAHLIETYESIARAAAAHVATVRAFGHQEALHAERVPAPDDVGDATRFDAMDAFTVEPRALGDQHDARAALDELAARDEPFSVLLFDVDELADYHDHHGDGAAEAALQVVAAVADRHLGDACELFRIAGDRFLVPLRGATVRDALATADHLRHALARTIAEHDLPPFTMSMGAVEAGTGTSADRVLRSVTDALHNARARGNDRVVVGVDVGSVAMEDPERYDAGRSGVSASSFPNPGR